MPDTTITVTISAEHHEKLNALADAKAISVDELVEQLIDAESE